MKNLILMDEYIPIGDTRFVLRMSKYINQWYIYEEKHNYNSLSLFRYLLFTLIGQKIIADFWWKQEFTKGENEQIEGNLGGPREWEKSTFKLFYSFYLSLPSKDDIS